MYVIFPLIFFDITVPRLKNLFLGKCTVKNALNILSFLKSYKKVQKYIILWFLLLLLNCFWGRLFCTSECARDLHYALFQLSRMKILDTISGYKTVKRKMYLKKKLHIKEKAIEKTKGDVVSKGWDWGMSA